MRALTTGMMGLCLAASIALAQEPPTRIEDVPQIRPGVPAGYLPREQLIDSLALVGAPPTGEALAVDEATRKSVAALRNGARWRLAARDADLTSSRAVEAFSCALGVAISAEATPHLNMLMRRSLVDAGLATYGAKNRHQRQRPFVVANDPEICTPAEADALRKDGSFPSGHASLGWAWGLILIAVAPERANALIQRAYDFGQSRVICGVHWQSDVDAGRLVGAAAVAQLQSNDTFRAQLAAAQREYMTAKARGEADCALEEQARGR